jgi:hypothetical protein
MGDTVVVDRLDTIIQTAEAELNRIFKVEDRTQLSDAQAIDNLVQLPVDYREMRVLSCGRCPEMKYWIPAKFFSIQRRYKGSEFYSAGYTIVNRNISLAGNITPTSPVDLTLMYYMNIPKFKDVDTSWLAEDYLDVYLYCVLKHTAPFLREDERLGTWDAMYGNAIGTALEENNERKYAGSPLKMHFPAGIR